MMTIYALALCTLLDGGKQTCMLYYMGGDLVTFNSIDECKAQKDAMNSPGAKHFFICVSKQTPTWQQDD